MLKMLRADFYKIVRSKVLLSLFIITLLTTLIMPIFMLTDSSEQTVFGDLFGGNTLASLSWIFIVPFVCKDFSGNFIKNVLPTYTKKDRVYYVLSKLLYIFIFCVLYFLITFIATIIFNYAFSKGVMYDKSYDNFTLAEFWLNIIATLLNAVAIGALLLFMCMALKKEYFVIVIFLPYMFYFCSLIYNAIDEAIFNATQEYTNYTELFTLFGPVLSTHDIEEFPVIIGMSLLYTAVFSVLGWLVFRKRSY